MKIFTKYVSPSQIRDAAGIPQVTYKNLCPVVNSILYKYDLMKERSMDHLCCGLYV